MTDPAHLPAEVLQQGLTCMLPTLIHTFILYTLPKSSFGSQIRHIRLTNVKFSEVSRCAALLTSFPQLMLQLDRKVLVSAETKQARNHCAKGGGKTISLKYPGELPVIRPVPHPTVFSPPRNGPIRAAESAGSPGYYTAPSPPLRLRRRAAALLLLRQPKPSYCCC